MPRMLRRAAVLGATAHVAAKRGAAQGAAQAEAAEEAAPAAPPAPVEEAPTSDMYEDLTKLKELFDAGVLTQEEFDAQKAKVLAG